MLNLTRTKKLTSSFVAEAIERAGWSAVAERIRGCGTEGKRYKCRDCGWTWAVGDWCMHRLCPGCGSRRAGRLFEAHRHLTGRPNLKHLVLTFVNVQGLSWQYLEWVRGCFTRLRRRKLFRQSWVGGVYAIEFTYTKAKGWHVHIHALVDGRYVPQAVIAGVWRGITGSAEVVWIERAKSSRQVLKYILKPTMELLDSPDVLDNFLTVTEGRHFVSGWGKWYRVSERKLFRGDLVCPKCQSPNVTFLGWVAMGPGSQARGP